MNVVSNSNIPGNTKQQQKHSGKISSLKANMSITQSCIPAYYDERVKVEPCDPARVPYLPVQILYLIARALPNPKSVLNLALSSKETWEYLQPALFECEVTFESRLGELYGGISSDSLQQHFRKHLKGSDDDDDSEDDSTMEPENSDESRPATGKACRHGRIVEHCDVCGERIRLEDRSFESPLPDNLLFADRRLTALHWACIQGPSALPVALKAIRSALAHQPSYIDGVGLRERIYHNTTDKYWKPIPGDLPPPLFFAAAYGNTEVCKALIEAGCDVNLLQGQSECREFPPEADDWVSLMAFKVHKECVMSRGETSHDFTVPLACVCQWFDMYSFYDAPGCQTAGHVAIEHEQIEILEVLLQGGLDIQKGCVPLINYSVVQGSVAAVKTLLEYDPSLFHQRAWNRPLIQAVAYIQKRPGDDSTTHYGRVRHMLEYLVANGANIDSESDSQIDGVDDEDEDLEMTALQTVLGEARLYDQSMTRIVDLLIAAEVFVRGGANWDRPLFSMIASDKILEISVVQTAGIFTDEFPFEDEAAMARALESRKCWGRLVKAMIETASQSQADADNPAASRAIILGEFSNAFTHLVNFHDPENGPNRFGPWGAEAVGKLLLSTGITPGPVEMEKWKSLCLNRESWISEDGDRSQWEFLLADVEASQLKVEWNAE